MKTINVKDALQLEEYEQLVNMNNRTRRAITDTYGPKQATKKRRKLANGRKWKDKERHYAKLQGQMTAKEFNMKQKASKVIEKIFKENARARQRHSLVD